MSWIFGCVAKTVERPNCDGLRRYSAAEVERMMKLQDVMLKAIPKKITWWAAAEIIGAGNGDKQGAVCERTNAGCAIQD